MYVYIYIIIYVICFYYHYKYIGISQISGNFQPDTIIQAITPSCNIFDFCPSLNQHNKFHENVSSGIIKEENTI